MSYNEFLYELVSQELLIWKQTKLGTIFEVLGGYNDFTMYKRVTLDGFNDVKKRDESMRRVKRKVYEIVTIICRFLVNDASNASFIKS